MVAAVSSLKAESAAPKKIENTRICRISFPAMASKKLRGTRWATKSLRLSAVVLRFVVASAGGSGSPRLRPGCSTFTSSRPSRRETTLAVRNQPIAFIPMRPGPALLVPGHAGHQRREDEGRDDHLDEPEEDVREEGEVAGDGLGRGGVGR